MLEKGKKRRGKKIQKREKKKKAYKKPPSLLPLFSSFTSLNSPLFNYDQVYCASKKKSVAFRPSRSLTSLRKKNEG
jgi:hypothetical protein